MRWHFLGPVQRNKVKRLAPLVSTWHGIDRPVAVDAVAAACPGVEVFVQVNLTGSPGPAGLPPGGGRGARRALPEPAAGVERADDRRPPPVTWRGARECFRWLASSARQLGLRELSMGMSDDFEVAAEEGATTLRLGRVLFGPRPRLRSAPR